MRVYFEQIHREYTFKKLHKECGIAHWHQRVEFVYVLEGLCEIQIGRENFLCSAGDFAVIHSGEIHSIADVRDSRLYVCTFNPGILRYFSSEMYFLQSFIPGQMLRQAGVADDVRKSFEECFREYTKGKNWSDIFVQSNIVRIYSLLMRDFVDNSKKRPKNAEKFQQFQEAMRYIEEHYAENITLDDVARFINYNNAYLSTLFVSYTGLNFKTYLDSIRINRAVKLIKHTDLAVSEISAQCGFVNIRTFNNVFRRVTGMTPSQLRKTNST